MAVLFGEHQGIKTKLTYINENEFIISEDQNKLKKTAKKQQPPMY